jgi:hypothetical protein
MRLRAFAGTGHDLSLRDICDKSYIRYNSDILGNKFL